MVWCIAANNGIDSSATFSSHVGGNSFGIMLFKTAMGIGVLLCQCTQDLCAFAKW